MRKKVSVNLCEEYMFDEKILVNYTDKLRQVMILDIGAPVSLAGKQWMSQYLKEYSLEIKKIKACCTSSAVQVLNLY